jgi:hypothetical protein
MLVQYQPDYKNQDEKVIMDEENIHLKKEIDKKKRKKNRFELL